MIESGALFNSPGATISGSGGGSAEPAANPYYFEVPCTGGDPTCTVSSRDPTGYSVRYSLNGAPYVVGDTVSFTIDSVPGFPQTMPIDWKYNPVTTLAVSGYASPSTAGVASAVTVEARDAYGNTAIGYRGTVQLTSSDPLFAAPAAHAFAASDRGRFTFTGLVLKTSGQQRITAQDTATASITGAQSSIVINAQAAATRLVLSGLPSMVSAGTSQTVTVSAKDTYGNLVPSYAQTVHFTSTEAGARLPADYRFVGADGGAHSFAAGATFYKVGNPVLTVTDAAATPLTASLGTAVYPDPNTLKFVVSGIPSPIFQSVAADVTVEARDAYENRRTDFLGTIRFSSLDPAAQLPLDYMFLSSDQGIRTLYRLITFWTPGPGDVTVHQVLNGSLTSSAGTESITVQADTIAPRLVVNSPANGLVTNQTSIQVAGTVIDETAISLKVNGTALAVNNGAFSTSVTLVEGSNTIAVNAADAMGNASNVSRFVVRSTVPPTVNITSPTGGSTTASDTVTVAGTVSDPVAIQSVTVNGLAVTFASGSFTMQKPVAMGSNTFTVVATDVAGNVGSASVTVTRVANPPTWPAGSTLTGTNSSTATLALNWSAATDPYGVTAYKVYQNGVAVVTTDGNTRSAALSGLTPAAGYTLAVQAGNAAGLWSLNGPTLSWIAVPPDPALTAPPIDRSVATSLPDSIKFLHSGPNAVQGGVADGTMDPRRVALLRGTVLTRTSAPLPGVLVSVHNHPEYGSTLSRVDGQFDLVINGGVDLMLDFVRDGFVPVQRSIGPGWKSTMRVPDITMIPFDSASTLVDTSGSSYAQVHRATASQDADGARQATLIIPPGTTATLQTPSGPVPVSTLHIRATEHTVGSSGPSTMPGPLPSSSAYTYAVALTADEAVAAGATSVQFSQPVVLYVDNFVGFPIGATVPLGYYDRTLGRWTPADGGVVLKVLAANAAAGTASLDVDGSGTAATSATLTSLGITNAELDKVSKQYTAGTTLWRVQLQHFSDWDLNWGYEPEDGPLPPDQGDDLNDVKDPCETGGSIIECENQVLGERFPIAGTPYTLNYRSNMVPGRKSSYTRVVKLTGPVVSSRLQTIHMELSVAGQVVKRDSPPT